MSIPVALQQFKSAGIYRVVYDKSTILNQDTQIMRLVVGYSPQGPFNIPVLIRTISEFKQLFGEGSKTLEKRGVYFHRIALQCLTTSPIICLNLKRFSGETLQGATIDTGFNPDFEPIDTVTLNVEDIYDTTRFWELSAFKLAEIRDINNKALDGYISLSSTNTKDKSVTFFIRKASGQKVAGYNITISDWYNDGVEEVPEYLQNKLNNKVSDFFAEIYLFKGEFTTDQVLSSETLKNYFQVIKENGEDKLVLRPFVYNAYGDPIDTLDALYNDSTSGAINHYIGSLIPYFKDKQGVYQALDIIMNNDIDINNVMMNFNVDALEDGSVNIDLSGKVAIPVQERAGISVDKIYDGEGKTTLLGNIASPVVSDEIQFVLGYKNAESSMSVKRIAGNWYTDTIVAPVGDTNGYILMKDMDAETDGTVKVNVAPKYWDAALQRFGINTVEDDLGQIHYYGGIFCEGLDTEVFHIPAQTIISITNHNATIDGDNAELNYNPKVGFAMAPVAIETVSNLKDPTQEHVYDSSVTFIPKTDEWNAVENFDGSFALTSTVNNALSLIFEAGDCLLAKDATTDADFDGETDKADGFYDNVFVQEVGNKVDKEGTVTYYVKLTGEPLLYTASTVAKAVVLTNSIPGWEGRTFYIPATAAPGDGQYYQLQDESHQLIDVWVTIDSAQGNNVYAFTSYGKNDQDEYVEYATGTVKRQVEDEYVVRISNPLNQEIGTLAPVYLEGYTYFNPKPASTAMYDKQVWQDFILSTLTDYKGIRTGLLSIADVDYRYIVDTFETYVTNGAKNVLSFLAKEKEMCFAILNFPSVRTFVKCPYTSFTDSKGVFNVEYVVKGYNPKKAHTTGFSLPSDSEGASFCAFYTPLKFSDGYIDSLIPSAGLVSNLFIDKYMTRQPYYIIAGPNYGAISASGMVGPDYNYSRAELNIIEPYGVNCMVYVPNFGTFINANQTAKQTPKSALSSVNVRELVIYLQDEIGKVLQQFQWEFNNQTVRNKIKDKADAICARVMANGGLQDYLNIMDESNNTPEIIDNEMAVLSTHIEPGRGMGKMVHELTLYRTGMMRSTISEA